MAEKELRKMSRTELIEIIYALQQNEKQLKNEIESLRKSLNEKTIIIENSGSIAEAALKLNHIFEDAQAAAEQYIQSIQTMKTMQAMQAIQDIEKQAEQTKG